MAIIHQNPVYVVIVIALLGFMIGLTKGGFNMLGSLLTPILSLVLPVSSAVGVLLPMLMVGDLFALYTYWKKWDARLTWKMLPWGVLGALTGTYFLAHMSANGLRIALGVFILFVIAYKFASQRITSLAYQPQSWHLPAVGTLTGLTSGMFNNGGPAFNSFLLLLNLPSQTFIATTVLFFALLNLIKVPGFLITGVLNVSTVLSLWWVFLFIPAGIWVARWLVNHISQQAFEWTIIALLFLSSALLFVQAS